LVGRSSSRGAPTATGAAGAATDFEAFYEQYRRPLFAFCLARLGDRELAEDVVQEAFAKALAVLPRFDASRPFWPWLVSIAARECIDIHRKRVLTTSRHIELSLLAEVASPHSTAQVALDRLAYETVRSQVERLAPRQRAALQLFAFDGWSYADIADRLGCSVGTVKLLIVRARARLRDTQARVLAGLGSVLQGIRFRAQNLPRLVPWWVRPGGFSQREAESPAALVLLVIAGLAAVQSPSAGEAQRNGEPVPAFPDPRPAVGRPALSSASTAAPQIPPEPVVQARGRTAQRAVQEAAAPTAIPPEEGLVQKITVSPGYDSDHTVFARDHGLMVSRDGGASWSRLRALGLTATNLLLPPAYPHDGRLFAFGYWGLQLSDNDGDAFETVAPGTFVDGAMSPRFDAGDPSILLVTAATLDEGAVLRYNGRTGLLEPLPAGPELAGHLVTGVRYDNADPDGRTVLLLSRRYVPGPSTDDLDVAPGFRSYLSTCALLPESTLLHCTTRRLELDHSPMASLGAGTATGGSHLLFVRDVFSLLLSSDGGRRFRPVTPWEGTAFDHANHDVATLPGSPASLLVAGVGSLDGPALLRTDDAGASWTPLSVDVPGFHRGAVAVAVTPTGRILAGGSDGGIACSVDGGRTWAPLCLTPDA
jgi:RNA polymerase sigma-70 factor (ECF subfamily)